MFQYIPDSISGRFPRGERLAQAADSFLKVSSSWLPHGVDIFKQEWDVLVILDTCRADAMNQIAPEYEFLDTGTSVWSIGSATREWVAHTFTTDNLDVIENTALVTANASSRWALQDEAEPDWPEFAKCLTRWDTVDPEDFVEFDEVWRYGPKNPFTGTVMPCAVTDRAISTWRSTSADRMLVHYLPPHRPYGSRALRENRPLTDRESDPWTALKNGAPRDDIWEMYLDELAFGLDSVRTLVDDIDADDIVITADHGEAFGEFGLYAHPMIPVPCLREVPWIETAGNGQNKYKPQLIQPAENDDNLASEVEKQLKALGYR